jgi:hypothetical protein
MMYAGEERRILVLLVQLKERDHLEDPGIETIILKQNLKKWDDKVWTGLIWLRTCTNGGFL